MSGPVHCRDGRHDEPPILCVKLRSVWTQCRGKDESIRRVENPSTSRRLHHLYCGGWSGHCRNKTSALL